MHRVNILHISFCMNNDDYACISGFIYDFRKSYDDVFYVVGCLYIIDTVVFALIPILKKRRERRERTECNEFSGIISNKQTFRISTKRSVSKSSLANEDQDGMSEYGTTASTRTPPGEYGSTVPKTPPSEYNRFESNNTTNNMSSYNHKMAAQAWQWLINVLRIDFVNTICTYN